jgi:hypothetical protein
MLEARQLIELSAGVEHVLRVGAALVFAALVVRAVVRALRGGAIAPRARLAISPRGERLAMLVILGWTLLTRLPEATSPQQPRFYFSQVSTLYVADALQAPDLARRWLGLLGSLQVNWEHDSPIQAPVAAAFQRVLGPSIELPTYVGAFWAALAVLLAWRLGRAVESPALGVLFAALLAISPVQITWSRLGGIYIGASAGVLLALLAGWRVGRARGVVAALFLGVVAWSCVYFYYPARVGMGLALVALWAGWRRSGRGAARLGVLFAATLAGLAACFFLHRAYFPGQSLWPAYQTYLGGRGETNAQEWIASLLAVVRDQLRIAVDDYFWRERMGAIARTTAAAPSGWPGTPLAPGMTAGGLVLLPLLLAGIVGVVSALRHPIERALWLALAVCGFLPPLLGFPSARRALVFDMAWCALAALGLLVLAESRLLDPATSGGRWRWAAALVAAIGLWSALTLGLADAALPAQHVPIPFGESGFGDGATCLGCIDAARSWQREMESGRLVVMLDTDMYRENATSPGGIMLYGKTAALAAGRPDRFLDYYTLVANYDPGPSHPGALAPAVPDDVADALAARIEAAAPSAVVWWITQPNAWERRLADALVAAGSVRTDPPARPMWGADRTSGAVDPIRIETPTERRRDALAALRALVDPPSSPTCVRLERITSRPYREWPLLLAPMGDGSDGPPEWAVGSWRQAEVWGRAQPAAEPIGLQYGSPVDGRRTADVVDMWGNSSAWTSSGESQIRSPAPGPRPLGRHCAALHDEQWWVVDPVRGALWMPGSPGHALPLDAIGIAHLGDDLVVATADQRLLVFDAHGQGQRRSFPATIVPARRFHYGECAMLASGRDWIASLDSLRGFLNVYDASGAPLGRVSLAQAVGTTPGAVHTIRGAGDYLGVGHDTAITTLRVLRDAACATAARE